jgi:hypothetical protein
VVCRNGVHILVAAHTLVPDNKGATAQLLPFNIGVSTLVVPHTKGDNTDVLPHTFVPLTKVVPHKLVPVKLPFKVTSSLNVISLPPVRELKASAQTVPLALMLPDTVKASVGTLVPIPTLPPVWILVDDNNGVVTQVLPFTIGDVAV